MAEKKILEFTGKPPPVRYLRTLDMTSVSSPANMDPFDKKAVDALWLFAEIPRLTEEECASAEALNANRREFVTTMLVIFAVSRDPELLAVSAKRVFSFIEKWADVQVAHNVKVCRVEHKEVPFL